MMSSEGTELTTIAGTKGIELIKVNEDRKQYSDDEDQMMGGLSSKVPTPRSPDDDLSMALQFETATGSASRCTQLCTLLSSCCGCCCCCVYSQSEKSPTNYVSESSDQYWVIYPFMRAAHRWWKVFLCCYLLLSIPFIYASVELYSTTCSSAILKSVQDYGDLTGDTTDFCNFYFWMYLMAAPLMMLIVSYITERVTLHDDMRGDRLVCLLNAIALIIVIYLFVFLGRLHGVVMDYGCIDYHDSASTTLQSACQS